MVDLLIFILIDYIKIVCSKLHEMRFQKQLIAYTKSAGIQKP